MIRYFNNYFERIRNTKKVARDKNIQSWIIPVFDSIIITAYFSWELSIGFWYFLYTWQESHSYSPWYMEMVWNVVSYSFLIFTSIILLSVLDKMILFFIHLHAYVNKLVLDGISKLDMYLWRKTGRDSVITNAIWKIQIKYMRLSKRNKKLMKILFVCAIVLYYGWVIA